MSSAGNSSRKPSECPHCRALRGGCQSTAPKASFHPAVPAWGRGKLCITARPQCWRIPHTQAVFVASWTLACFLQTQMKQQNRPEEGNCHHTSREIKESFEAVLQQKAPRAEIQM